MAKQRVQFGHKERHQQQIDNGLYLRLREQALTEGRSMTSIVEQALAEYLAIPLANPDLPEQPVELCPSCEKGVLWRRRCSVCGWRRVDPRAKLSYSRAVRDAFWASTVEGPVPEHRPELGPCLLWQGHVNKQTGYGMVGLQDRTCLAHRVAWEDEYGDIPTGLELDHLCRVRHCVRPSHLEPVTHAENQRRAARTRLTATDVETIRASSASSSALARTYGVTQGHVSRIRQGLVWRG